LTKCKFDQFAKDETVKHFMKYCIFPMFFRILKQCAHNM
jgi:hypothetical protein